MSVEESVRRLRNEAARHRSLAEEATTETMRRHLLLMARHYYEVAVRLEASEKAEVVSASQAAK